MLRLRLMTYNVHKFVGGLDRRRDVRRVAETIAFYRPDVVLLQEVVDLEPLASLLSLPHSTHRRHTRRRDGLAYGNAVLSRFPIRETTLVDLTVPLKKSRAALHAVLSAVDDAGHAHAVHVFNLHLGLSGLERRAQLRRFLGAHPFAQLHAQTPVVVAGYFNDVWGTLGRSLLEPAGLRPSGCCAPTFPAFAPLRRLDAVYLRGRAACEHAEAGGDAAARLASDHLPLVVDLALPGAAEVPGRFVAA